MKRSMLVLLSITAVTFLVAGVAYAATINCDGGECYGTAGADTMRGTMGVDTMFGEDGNDLMYGGAGNDAVKGGVGKDRVFGGEGADKVKGGPGADRVKGGAGNDVVRGGFFTEADDGVQDLLNCGTGRDVVYYTEGVDVIRDCEIKRPS